MRLITDDVLAAVTIYQEAAGESYEGKLAVAEVIRNRMARKYASDGSVAGTVLRAWQFSGWNTDAELVRIRSVQIDGDNPTVRQCLAAWKEAITDHTQIVKGAVLYLNPQTVLRQTGKLPGWAAKAGDPTQVEPSIITATIGHHIFLRSSPTSVKGG